MLRKIICLSILASLVAGMLRAQDFGTLSGFVVNEAGEPLEEVTVQLIGANRITNTNSAGWFRFTRIPFGEYVIQVSYVGYESELRRIRHSRANTEPVTVRLRADVNQLGEVSVRSSSPVNQELDPSKQDYLIEGKKTEGIQLEKLDADISQKNARQIFARIPGIFVYDMDGSGNQVNISSRGLDPHRSWEFNVRMDGIITNSDMYGYPASHFSMPMESVEKIELIHGTAALQYGAQFGGMLNYISKKGDSTRKIGFETINSAGSFGMLSTYNALGGKIGKLRYYAYFSKRGSDGFRDHARSDYESEYVNLTYDFNSDVQLEAGLARSVYTYAIPGPLTEAEFLSDPRQASRKRNYYSPDILVPSLRLKARLRNGGTINWLTSAVLGERSSVQFTGVSGVADVQDANGKWPARQVDIDNYHSFTTEFIYRKSYRFLSRKAALNSGIRLISNDLYRRQKGIALTDFGDDYSVTPEGFERDLHYYTDNAAVFAEQSVHISDRLVINAGFRLEKGLTRMRGRITNYSESNLPNDINHLFVLPGISFERQINSRNKVFGGWSQAYRPVIFADIIPANPYERADRNLKDAKGHISELGVQGNSQDFRFRYSVNLFEILYRNRMGKQMIEEQGQTILFRTNVGNSLTFGVESYLSFATRISEKFNLSVFSSTSFMHGSYLKGMVTNGKTNESIKGNLLETVPQWISRNGFTLSGKTWSSTALGSYTSSFYSDPLNTEFVVNGTVGKVPGYFLLDWNSTVQVTEHIHARIALNNVLNKTYYTKRPNGYPGPGIWTSDGRSVSFTLGLKI